MYSKFLPYGFIFYIIVSCKPIDNKKESFSQASLQTISLKLAFYNLENYFDTQDDPRVNDNDFLPSGKMQWTEEKYEIKTKNLASIISSINPDIIGLCEMENLKTLEKLNTNLNKSKYKIIHFESHDIRGIDIALLYNSKILELLKASEISAKIDGKYAGPRNILKADFQYGNEKITVYVNHWPSRKKDREENRIAFANALSENLKNNPIKNIFVLGDFNDTPQDQSLLILEHENNLTNLFSDINPKNGTCSHQNQWFCFDQILYCGNFKKDSFGILNENKLLNFNHKGIPTSPKRSFIAEKFNPQGYSDHLPVWGKFVK